MLEIQDSIIFNNEKEYLQKSELSLVEAFTLTFSAKESLFKALYSSVGDYFDFSAAKITKLSVKDKSSHQKLVEMLHDVHQRKFNYKIPEEKLRDSLDSPNRDS